MTHPAHLLLFILTAISRAVVYLKQSEWVDGKRMSLKEKYGGGKIMWERQQRWRWRYYVHTDKQLSAHKVKEAEWMSARENDSKWEHTKKRIYDERYVWGGWGWVVDEVSDFWVKGGEIGAPPPKDSAICSPWSPQLIERSADFSSTARPLVISPTTESDTTVGVTSSGMRNGGGGDGFDCVREKVLSEWWTGLEVIGWCWDCLLMLLLTPLLSLVLWLTLLLPWLAVVLLLLFNIFKCRIILRERKSYQARQRNTFDGVASSGNSDTSLADS